MSADGYHRLSRLDETFLAFETPTESWSRSSAMATVLRADDF